MVGPNEPDGVALRGLRRAGVVDGVVAQVVRHRLAGVQPLLDLGVRDVAGHDQRAGQRQPGLDRVPRQLGPDLGHRPVEVDPHHVRPGRLDKCSSVVSGRNRAGSVSSCSRKTPSAVILPSAWRSAEQETAIATGHEAPCRGSRTTRTSWQKYLPPNCAPMPKLRVSSRTSASSSRSRNPCAARNPTSAGVEVLGRGVLRGLQGELGRGAADDDRQVVRRAGRGAQRAQLLVQEAQHPLAGSGPPWSPGRGTTCWPSRRPWP